MATTGVRLEVVGRAGGGKDAAMRSSRLMNVSVLVVVLVLVGACSTGGQAETPLQSTPPAGPPADGGSFASPQEITDKLREAGLICAGLREVAGRSGAARCTGEADEPVVIAVYSDPAVLADEVSAMDSGIPIKLGGRTASMVNGKNWTLLAPDVWADRAQRILGGTLTVSS